MKLLQLKTPLLLILLLFFTTLSASDNAAGKKLLKGKVVDQSTKEALIGATIYVQELKTGTATDINGNFRIKLAEENTL